VPNEYLVREGLFLYWWVVVNWIVLGVSMCCLLSCVMCLKKLLS
jgi:hypothetical protein